jgi:predicted RNA-binding Zn ribbon-like protein
MAPRYDLPKAAPEPLRLIQRFVNTADRQHNREWLASPSDLADWLDQAGLGVTKPTRGDLLRAHELRDALRSLLAANTGAALDPEAVATVNRSGSAAQLTVELDQRGQLRFDVNGRDVDAALGRIVAVAFSALTDGAWSRLKPCQNCNWTFYDSSRNRSAKWCAMAICGNRRKSREYRRRRRSSPQA